MYLCNLIFIALCYTSHAFSLTSAKGVGYQSKFHTPQGILQRRPLSNLNLGADYPSKCLNMPRGGASKDSLEAAPPRLPLSVFLSSLPSLLHGYDTGVIAGALLYLVPALGLESAPGLVGLMVTACTLGAILGSCIVNSLLSSFGRIGTLRLGSWVFLTSSVLSGLSPNYWALVAARFMAGVAMGTSSATVPVYISETSPAECRGKAATVPQFMISSGILLSYAVDLAILAIFGGRWRVMLGAAVIPSIVMMIGVHTLVESPRYLASKGKTDEALENLKKIRGTEDVGQEWSDIVSGLKSGEVRRPAGHTARCESLKGWHKTWRLIARSSRNG